MKLHFANSALIKSPERAIFRGGSWRNQQRLRVRYGVFEHPDHGPILIDTGYSRHAPSPSLGMRLYTAMLGPDLQLDGDIDAVLGRFGYERTDVRIIVVTHFHADHIAALSCFPQARILADHRSLRAIQSRGALGNLRHGVFAELLPDDTATRLTDIATLPQVTAPLNLQTGRDLLGDGSMLAIDLPGHAEGHFGLCFPWLDPVLLYACDVQWSLAALDDPRALPLLGRLISHNKEAALRSTQTIATFRDQGGQVMLCHDPALTSYDLAQSDNG